MARDVEKVLDSKYAWVVMISAFFVQALAITMRMCGSVLMVDYSETFDVPMATIGASIATFSGVANFSGFWMGSVLHKYGAKKVCIGGSLLAATGFFATAFVQNIYWVFITYGVLGGLGDMAFQLSSTVVVQQYFNKKRALAGGLITVGVGVGATGIGPFYVALSRMYGWRGALILHSGVILNGVAFGALFRPLPKPKKASKPSSEACTTGPSKGDSSRVKPRKSVRTVISNIFDGRVIRNQTFQLYAAGTMFWFYGMLTFYTFLPSWAVSIGLSKNQTGVLLVLLGVCSTVSRLVTSIFANMACTNRTLLVAVATMAGALPVTLAAFAKVYSLALLATGLTPALLGIVGCVQSTVLVDLLGKETISKSQGWLYTFRGICGLLCLPVSGWLFDITDSYTVPLLVAASMLFFGGCCTLVIYFKTSCSCHKKHSEHTGDRDVELT